MKIIGIGDSIMAYNDCRTYPQTGWLQKLELFLEPEYEISVLDLAQNGRSTKSYLAEGLFERCRRRCRWGDLVLISFGHNDEKEDSDRHTEPEGDYRENLSYMCRQIRLKGAEPILLSPWPRLRWADGRLVKTHGAYPAAMKALAATENTRFIDLEKLGSDCIEALGPERAERLFLIFPPGRYPNYPEGRDDKTHLSDEGAFAVAGLVAGELKKMPDLRRYFV